MPHPKQSSTLIRAFFAFDLDAPLRDAVRQVVADLGKQPHGDQVKWATPEQLHVTLRFLGETPEEQLTTASARVAEQIKTIPALTVEVGHVAAFPISRPHIIALMFRLSTELATLVRTIEDTVNQCGFMPEPRPYLPHLTLARLRNAKSLPALNHGVTIPKTLMVKEVILFRSETGPRGSVYTPLHKFQLQEKQE